MYRVTCQISVRNFKQLSADLSICTSFPLKRHASRIIFANNNSRVREKVVVVVRAWAALFTVLVILRGASIDRRPLLTVLRTSETEV